MIKEKGEIKIVFVRLANEEEEIKTKIMKKYIEMENIDFQKVYLFFSLLFFSLSHKKKQDIISFKQTTHKKHFEKFSHTLFIINLHCSMTGNCKRKKSNNNKNNNNQCELK